MGIKDAMVKKVMDESMKTLGKTLESIHCYLEIIAHEQIRLRLLKEKDLLGMGEAPEVDNKKIDSILKGHEDRLS